MRILELGKFWPIGGGVEKVMYDITRGVSAKGVDVDMLCAAFDPQTIQLNEHGRVIAVKSYAKKAATMIAPAMITKLRKICNEYDIIHVHHPDPMAALALFLSGYKGKVILHWHSDILSQKFFLAFYKPLQSWLIKRTDLILGTTPVYVAQSPYLQKVQDKINYLPIGIEDMTCTEEQVQKIKAQYPGKKIVFSLGRLVPYKGFTYLIDAAKYLSDEYHIVIGGTGPLKDELLDKINSTGVSNKVSLVGFVPDEDIAAWYNACDLFCLSSIWKTEAFAIVQIEAMSCSKPIVATTIPESGVSWVNAHGISGLNVAPEDGKALAEAISKITSDTQVYEEFSRKAKQRFEENFRFEKMIEKFLSFC